MMILFYEGRILWMSYFNEGLILWRSHFMMVLFRGMPVAHQGKNPVEPANRIA